MTRSIANQVVVITGASSGIGRCTARYLARRGARVVVTARRMKALEQLVREIEAAGGQAVAVPGDVTREDDVRGVARVAMERFGRIDTWVNNGAVYIQGRVQDVSLDEYRRVLEVNLIGLISGTKCALEVMTRQREGTIIQISSILGRRAAAYSGAYSASKAGIDGFTQALRTELRGTDIHISTLYVPTVDTPVYQHARGKFGTLAAPPPPVLSPVTAARVIGELAVRPRPERTFGLFGHAYLKVLNRLPPNVVDAFLHHAAGFTLSDRPSEGDNLDAPLLSEPARMRGGWTDAGWKGITLRKTVRVLPVESLVGAAALGFIAWRVVNKILREPAPTAAVSTT